MKQNEENGNPACFDKETLLVTCHSCLSRLIMIAKTENEISQIPSKIINKETVKNLKADYKT